MKQNPTQPVPKYRCFTRAIKNARFLQQADPATFAKQKDTAGFGTGVPIEIFRCCTDSSQTRRS